MKLSVVLVVFVSLSVILLTTDARRRSRNKGPKEDKSEREGKFFSLFSIVQFANDPCFTTETNSMTSSDSMEGTCLTADECSGSSGAAYGKCAAGFGVCCVHKLEDCGGTVTKNGTYIQNVGYPKGNTTASQTCNYEFDRIADGVCQLRLDFVNFAIQGPDPATGVCDDTLTVTSPIVTNTGTNLCGTLTGQHMYVETGSSGNAGSLEIATGTATSARTYRIKVTYIMCDSVLRAPEGCLQYFTGISGSFQSYAHASGDQPSEQSYSFCFRQEQGFCSYQISESSSSTLDAFDLRPILAPAVTETTAAICSGAGVLNYIRVQSDSSTPGDLRCGSFLSDVQGDEKSGVITAPPGGPLKIDYFSGQGLGAGGGFSLEYSQIPC